MICIPQHLKEYIVEYDYKLMCMCFPKINLKNVNKQEFSIYCVIHNIPNVLQHLLSNFKYSEQEYDYMWELAINHEHLESIQILLPYVDVNNKFNAPFIHDLVYSERRDVLYYIMNHKKVRITPELLDAAETVCDEYLFLYLKNYRYEI
jgi:hypothetical protein